MSIYTKESTFTPHVAQFWFEAEYQKAEEILRSEPFAKAKQDVYIHSRHSLKGTHHEYFFQIEGQRTPVLPFKLEIKDNRLFGFGDWYTEAINAQEHKGETQRTAQKIQDFIVKVPVDSIAFFVSPAGPAGGLKDEDGIPVIYKDTAVYILQKQSDTSVQAWNLFTDLSLLESERLLNRYSGHEFDTRPDLKDRMQTVVGNPVFISADSSPEPSLHTILENIQSVMGTNEVKPGVSFDRAHWLFDNPKLAENAWTNSDQIQQLLQKFENLIISAPDATLVMSTLRRELPKLVLQISAASRGKNPHTANLFTEAKYVSALPGCTTTGFVSIEASSPLYRIIKMRETVCQSIKCRKTGCDWEAKAEDFDENGKLKCSECPKCGWKPGDPT